jgi:lambda repressor-like predicted transcriptional regulator
LAEVKQFPILWHIRNRPAADGPLTVPWTLVEPHAEQARINHGQTLDRIADRGGLSPSELAAVLGDRPWTPMDTADALDVIRKEEVRMTLARRLHERDCPGDRLYEGLSASHQSVHEVQAAREAHKAPRRVRVEPQTDAGKIGARMLWTDAYHSFRDEGVSEAHAMARADLLRIEFEKHAVAIEQEARSGRDT